MERSQQLTATHDVREEFNMDSQDFDLQLKALEDDLYSNKNDDEFQLGLALITVLDSFDNPEEYNDDSLRFVYDNADELAAYFRMKYDKEIMSLNKTPRVEDD